ncbi:MAG: NAD-dependent epimerase/dehydratase family protein [Candidatus Competibacteraceae bacterium]|nr:NAD-dependent epimerase/dehydratase family protein [Candidatus Competibacteraceae bacterium]
MITGANGFTGRWLGRHLAASGYQVHGLVQGAAQTLPRSRGRPARPAALRAALATVRPDFIVHLAAITFAPTATALNLSGQPVRHANPASTPSWRPACNPRKILIASSANVYGNPPVEVIDSATSVCPASSTIKP